MAQDFQNFSGSSNLSRDRNGLIYGKTFPRRRKPQEDDNKNHQISWEKISIATKLQFYGSALCCNTEDLALEVIDTLASDSSS